MKKIILGLLLSPICFGAVADTIECIALKKNNTIELELNKLENHSNCFSLSEVPANSPVQFIGISNDNVKSKVSLFELNTGGTSEYIAEYLSDAGAATAFSTNTTNRTISFNVTPTSHLDSDKNISVTYLYFNGKGQIMFDLDDIPSTAPTPPPNYRRM